MSGIAEFLRRLDGVRETGQGAWVARCPAHADRHPSLSVGEKMDGTPLVHCFAGCDFGSVVAAVGMEIHELYPEAVLTRTRLHPVAHPFPARDVLECVAGEAAIVLICAADLAAGKTLSPPDHARLRTASQRLQEAIDVIRR